MEIVGALALLAPLVLFFLLTLAVTVHFFWLAHQGRWPPDLPARQDTSPARAVNVRRRSQLHDAG